MPIITSKKAIERIGEATRRIENMTADAAGAPEQHAPVETYPSLWEVTAVDSPSGYCTVRRTTYAGSNNAASERTVRYVTGDAPSVGDKGLLLDDAGGDLCFFRKFKQSLSPITISASQRVRIAGTYYDPANINIVNRRKAFSASESAYGYIYKFDQSYTVDGNNTVLWLSHGNRWDLSYQAKYNTDPGSYPEHVDCGVDLYLIYEDFTISGSEMSWATFNALSKSASVRFEMARVYFYYHSTSPPIICRLYGLERNNGQSGNKFFRALESVPPTGSQNVYGIAFIPLTVDIYLAYAPSPDDSSYEFSLYYNDGTTDPEQLECWLKI